MKLFNRILKTIVTFLFPEIDERNAQIRYKQTDKIASEQFDLIQQNDNTY
jgi:hypothetical protein